MCYTVARESGKGSLISFLALFAVSAIPGATTTLVDVLKPDRPTQCLLKNSFRASGAVG